MNKSMGIIPYTKDNTLSPPLPLQLPLLQRQTMTSSDVLYFADVCAAPGGFAEYAIWRRRALSDGFPAVHGFGFTLRSNDFKLQDFYAAPREFFEPHYGEMEGVEAVVRRVWRR